MEPALELEHLIGFSGRKPNLVASHPNLRDVYIYAVGSCIVAGNFSDPYGCFWLSVRSPTNDRIPFHV